MRNWRKSYVVHYIFIGMAALIIGSASPLLAILFGDKDRSFFWPDYFIVLVAVIIITILVLIWFEKKRERRGE